MRNYLVMLMMVWCMSGATAFAGTDVLLYPSGARVRVEESLPVRNGEITFLLPAQAHTLRLWLDEGEVISQEERPAALPDSASVAALREEAARARERAAALEGEQATATTRIALWTKEGLAPRTSVAELEKLDAAVSGRLRDLHVQLAALEPRVRKAQEEAWRLEKALERYGADAEGIRVTAQVTTRADVVRVRYAYMLDGCGWDPVYRFDAEPDQGVVRFVQDAKIRQSSGQDWKNVRLTLASADPGQGLSPAPLPVWRLRPLAPQQRMAADVVMPVASAPIMAEAKAAGNFAPREGAAFTTWDLGERDVPAGKPVLLELAHGDWKADFVRLARPGYGRKAAWLTAEVRLPEAVDFPQGEAQYLVDGMPVGTAPFSLTGKKADLSFGADARVLVDMKQDVRQRGMKGFVGKRQIRVWKWTIEVTNSHAKPVAVRVEDPEPQIGDKAIEVKVSADPTPTVKDHLMTWNLEVPASGKRVIDYTVEASAPEDMRFVDGR